LQLSGRGARDGQGRDPLKLWCRRLRGLFDP
jgi:hypothetical protein